MTHLLVVVGAITQVRIKETVIRMFRIDTDVACAWLGNPYSATPRGVLYENVANIWSAAISRG
jgi:hypothetical protein